MKGRTTLVLAAVFAGLCLGYWLMVRAESRRQATREETKRLFDFTPEDIVSLEVQQVDEVPASASRTAGSPWAFVKPNASIEANQVVWDRVAVAMAGLSNERTIEDGANDLAKYGLDKPVLEVEATAAGKNPVRAVFGALEPTQRYRYTRVDEGPVILASVKAFQELDRPLSLLRNPYVLSVGDAEITRLEFARYWPGGKDTEGQDRKAGEESAVVTVEKGKDGLWRLTSPVEGMANQEMVDGLIKEVQYATARNHIDEPKALSDYGLEPPKARITLCAGSAEPQTLLLGSLESGTQEKGQGGIYAKRSDRPSVFVMDVDVLNFLPRTPDAFREERLFTRQASDLKSIHYVAGTTDFTLEYDADKGWKLTQPAADDTDQLAVSNFIVLLKALKGRGFAGERKPEFGLDKPSIAVTFAFRNEPSETQVLVGSKDPGGQSYYATQDNGTVVLLGELDVTALTKTDFDFRKKALLEFARNQVVQISLKFEGTNYVFERPRGVWRVKEPAGKQLGSPNDVESLLESLGSFRALGVDAEVAPGDLSPFGLDNPLAEISVTMATAMDAQTVATVGPAQIGGVSTDNPHERHAIAAGLPGVYRVKQKIVDDIRDTLKGLR